MEPRDAHLRELQRYADTVTARAKVEDVPLHLSRCDNLVGGTALLDDDGRPFIELHPGTLTDPRPALVRAIVCHEVAHHALGHPAQADRCAAISARAVVAAWAAEIAAAWLVGAFWIVPVVVATTLLAARLVGVRLALRREYEADRWASGAYGNPVEYAAAIAVASPTRSRLWLSASPSGLRRLQQLAAA